MAKKKTRVALPGSLSDLVRDLQKGNDNASLKNKEERINYNEEQEEDQRNDGPQNDVLQGDAQVRNNGESINNNVEEPQPSPTPSQSASASEAQENNKPLGSAAEGSRAYSPGRPAKQNTMKEYHIVKDDSKDSWDLFLDMAKQYKDGGGKLATIYIDGTLKNILDRMKYVGPEKLPTSAVLSSIVARFIYDHEEDIRKALFSGKLF